MLPWPANTQWFGCCKQESHKRFWSNPCTSARGNEYSLQPLSSQDKTWISGAMQLRRSSRQESPRFEGLLCYCSSRQKKGVQVASSWWRRGPWRGSWASMGSMSCQSIPQGSSLPLYGANLQTRNTSYETCNSPWFRCWWNSVVIEKPIRTPRSQLWAEPAWQSGLTTWWKEGAIALGILLLLICRTDDGNSL